MPKEDKNNQITISVVLGSYNRLPFLKKLIKSVRLDLIDSEYEIIVVDGGSTDGTMQWLLRQKDILAIIQHNRGTYMGKAIKRKSWGYFMNLGFKTAKGKYVCMLSDDCLVLKGALKNGIKDFDQALKKDPRTGALAFWWRNWPEQENYWIGKTFGNNYFVNHGLYLNSALQKVGYADENTYFFYHGDGDLVLRMIEAGYTCIKASNSYIEHYSDANAAVRATNMTRQKQDWLNYVSKWSGLGDPSEDWVTKEHADPGNEAKLNWEYLRRKDQLYKMYGKIGKRLKGNT